MSHKKAFQSNASYLLAKCPCFMVNKLEYVEEGNCTDKGWPCRENLAWIPVQGGPSFVDRQTDSTENITFPQLRWRAVKIMDLQGVVQISRFSVSVQQFLDLLSHYNE